MTTGFGGLDDCTVWLDALLHAAVVRVTASPRTAVGVQGNFGVMLVGLPEAPKGRASQIL
jgi:hypothetical protein